MKNMRPGTIAALCILAMSSLQTSVLRTQAPSSGGQLVPDYFPVTAFDPSDLSHSKGIASIFTKILFAMQEEPITRVKSTTFRLTLFAPFSDPVSVRFQLDSGSAVLATKTLSGRLEIIRNVSKAIPPADADAVMKLIGSSNFWALPSGQPEADRLVDGTMWLLEGNNGHEYHLVYRYVPKASCYTETGRELLKLAGVMQEFASPYHCTKEGNN